MSIVTKTGDKGETGLFGGQRIAKDDLRIETIGTVDELNAMLGIVLAEPANAQILHDQLLRTQNVLFTLGADLATPKEDNKAVVPRIEDTHIAELEEWISFLEQTPLPAYFVLPGGSKGAAELHLSRAICRRAERLAVSLSKKTPIGAEIVKYLNRLSDYLFLAALAANREAHVADIRVSYS